MHAAVLKFSKRPHPPANVGGAPGLDLGLASAAALMALMHWSGPRSAHATNNKFLSV